MAQTTWIHRTVLLVAAFSTILLTVPVQAQVRNTQSRTASSSKFVFPTDSAPKETAGGASRGGCDLDSSSQASSLPANTLTVLKPSGSVGQTIAAHPTLLLYLPPGLPSKANFSLREFKTGRKIYQTMLNLSGISGLVKFPIPDNAPSLEVGTTYVWNFQVLCNGPDFDSPILSGSIARVSSPIAMNQMMANAATLAQAEIYTKNGIWHESLMALYNLRQTQPHNVEVAKAWDELLDSVKLDNFVLAPFATGTISVINQ